MAVVTGGSKGIGAATARALAANGVRVAVNARSQEGIDSIVERLRAAGGEAVGVSADCTSLDELERLRGRVEAELGPADILLPYTGGFTRFTPVEEIGEEEWRQVIDDNLTSTFLTIKAFLPGMIERRSGVIVTMSSITGRYIDRTITASYAAAKAGVAHFTRHIAIELGRYNIRANCLAPGTVRTERTDQIMEDDARATVAAMSPLGRMGTAHDCALATLYLVSDSAAWLTGNTLDVTGGRIML